MGKKHFCFSQTAETGNRTPNSSVKGGGANHHPRAPACRNSEENLKGGGAWYQYDTNLRKHKQGYRDAPWGQVHPDFFLFCFKSTQSAKPPLSQKGSSSKQIDSSPHEFCWRFHKGENCTGCKFNHQCFKCNTGIHPAAKCLVNAQPNRTNNRKPATTSSASNASKPKTSLGSTFRL